MQNKHKSDMDGKFTVRLYDFAFLRQNSRGLSDLNKRVLHSSTNMSTGAADQNVG